MSIKENESPYLNDNNRLSDIIAAIQVMATYRFYKLDIKEWSRRISGNDKFHFHWKQVFEEHSEFFRFNDTNDKVSLVWRRSKQRRFHVDIKKELSIKELDELDEETKSSRLTRTPLSSSDIETLISTAIDLHSRALENKKDERWWIIPLVSSLSGIVGVIVGSLLK